MNNDASESLSDGKSNRVTQQLLAEGKLQQQELEKALKLHDPNVIGLPIYLVRLGLVSEQLMTYL